MVSWVQKRHEVVSEYVSLFGRGSHGSRLDSDVMIFQYLHTQAHMRMVLAHNLLSLQVTMFSMLHLDSTQADLDLVQEEVGFVHYIVHLYFVATL